MTEVEFGLKLPYIRQFLVFGSLLISASKPNTPPLPVDQPAPLRLLVLQLHLGHHASGSILVSRCSTSTTDIRGIHLRLAPPPLQLLQGSSFPTAPPQSSFPLAPPQSSGTLPPSRLLITTAPPWPPGPPMSPGLSTWVSTSPEVQSHDSTLAPPCIGSFMGHHLLGRSGLSSTAGFSVVYATICSPMVSSFAGPATPSSFVVLFRRQELPSRRG